MAIPLVPPLPMGSSNLPESLDGPPSNALLFGFAPDGVYLAPDVTTGTGELLPHRFTLTPAPATPAPGRFAFCGTVLPLPRLGVTQHPALWSPDFPLTLQESQRPSALLQIQMKISKNLNHSNLSSASQKALRSSDRPLSSRALPRIHPSNDSENLPGLPSILPFPQRMHPG